MAEHEDIHLRWAPGMAPLVAPPGRFRQAGEVVALWYCPQCATACHRRHRAGRPKVYCTNACRQKAYRRRREQRQYDWHPVRPAERARTRERLHACRADHDVVVRGRRDSTGKVITACGAFGRADRDRAAKFWHTEFTSGAPWSCRSCTALLGVVDVPVPDMIARALTHRKSLR